MVKGRLMSLKDVAEWGSGGTPKRGVHEYFGEGMPWLSVSDLNDDVVTAAKESLTASGIEHSSAKVVPEGTVFIAMYASIGKLGVAGRPCCTSQAIAFAKPDTAIIDRWYLFYFLQAQREKFKSISNTGTQPNISQKILKAWPITVPDMDTQCRVVNRLDAVRHQIRLLESMLAKADELAQSRFVEMFGDPVQDGGRWSCRRMDSLYVVTSAKRIYARDLQTSGVPFLKLGDLTSRIAGDKASCSGYVDSETFARLRANDQVPQADDILVTARGTMGLCYVVKPTDDFYFQDGMITWLKQRKDSPDPLFLVHLFAMPSFRNQLLGITSGTTVSYLSIKALSNTEIPVPPIELQREFATFVRQVESLKTDLNQQLDRLNTLYDSLTQRYFME